MTNMNIPVIFRISMLSCVFLLGGCTYLPIGTYFMHGTTQYRGDGTICDVSQRSLFFSSRGYVIELEKFDLGDAYDKQFKLINLPTIRNSPVEISLAVEDTGIASQSIDMVDNLRKKLEAHLTMNLTDAAGRTITGFTNEIGKLVWSGMGGYPGHWLYDDQGSFFKPCPEETYTLHIQYSPDATLRGKHGCIHLYSGCGGS
jgi:hypothetical protein